MEHRFLWQKGSMQSFRHGKTVIIQTMRGCFPRTGEGQQFTDLKAVNKYIRLGTCQSKIYED